MIAAVRKIQDQRSAGAQINIGVLGSLLIKWGEVVENLKIGRQLQDAIAVVADSGTKRAITG